MAKSKKSTKKKLTAAQRVKQSATNTRKLSHLLKAEQDQITDQATRAVLADKALTLGYNALTNDSAIRKAFDAFGLYPKVPRHWHVLLSQLASAHFGETDTDAKYIQIALEFHTMLKTEERKNVIKDLAKRHLLSTRSIEAALKASKVILGYPGGAGNPTLDRESHSQQSNYQYQPQDQRGLAQLRAAL